MLEFENHTRWTAGLLPGTDKEGRDWLTVVIKASFVLEPGSGMLAPLAAQVPLVWADEHYGDSTTTSVRYEADTAPLKRRTDVVLIGTAYAPRERERRFDVRLDVGPVSKIVRVFGDRRWYRTVGTWKISEPEPARTIPLTYDRAFGGNDDTDPDPARHAYERRNPVGTGLAATDSKNRLEGLALPNLEDPFQLIERWDDRPPPAGFGFIGRGWAPRVDLAGTYDAAWKRDRAPLLPLDFNDAYFNGAHPDLITPMYLRGDEAVRVHNASPDGPLEFRLPSVQLEVSWCRKDEWTRLRASLDTVVLEPDERRVTLCLRASVPCPRTLLYIDKVTVGETRRAE